MNLTLLHPGYLVPVFWQGKTKFSPCHKSGLANRLMVKLGKIVDQVKWGLLVHSLLA